MLYECMKSLSTLRHLCIMISHLGSCLQPVSDFGVFTTFRGYSNTHLPDLKLSIAMIGPVSTLLITDVFPYMYVVVCKFRDRRRRTDRCAHGGGVPFGRRTVYLCICNVGLYDIHITKFMYLGYVMHDDVG